MMAKRRQNGQNQPSLGPCVLHIHQLAVGERRSPREVVKTCESRPAILSNAQHVPFHFREIMPGVRKQKGVNATEN